MFSSIVIPMVAAVLASAPESPPDTFTVERVEVDRSDTSVHLIPLDANGEPTGEVVFWVDGDERIHLDANFADGHYLSATVDGEDVTIETDDREQVAARVDEIRASLDGTEASLGGCGWAVAGAVAGCVAVIPWACVGGAIVSACECLPIAVDEFEGMDCPLFG